MRVALCEALFRRPALLLLDEPTNHLDLQSVVWLEEHLAEYDKILVVTSHSQDFLNGVCTNIIELKRRQLHYWAGNYAQFVKTKGEQEANQMKLYNKQQDEIKHIKEFIASCGTFANLVKQVCPAAYPARPAGLLRAPPQPAG
jgi:ATP-binding cassette subfamily F protein 2